MLHAKIPGISTESYMLLRLETCMHLHILKEDSGIVRATAKKK